MCHLLKENPFSWLKVGQWADIVLNAEVYLTCFNPACITYALIYQSIFQELKIANILNFTFKRIAGRIIPAIATTTAMVAGLISAELYKIAAKCDDIEKYRNTFMNLALPVYSFSEPMPAPKVRIDLQ